MTCEGRNGVEKASNLDTPLYHWSALVAPLKSILLHDMPIPMTDLMYVPHIETDFHKRPAKAICLDKGSMSPEGWASMHLDSTDLLGIAQKEVAREGPEGPSYDSAQLRKEPYNTMFKDPSQVSTMEYNRQAELHKQTMSGIAIAMNLIDNAHWPIDDMQDIRVNTQDKSASWSGGETRT